MNTIIMILIIPVNIIMIPLMHIISQEIYELYKTTIITKLTKLALLLSLLSIYYNSVILLFSPLILFICMLCYVIITDPKTCN